MGPKALLVWELGEGLGHVMRLAEAGRALSNAGWQVQYIVQRMDALAQVDPSLPAAPAPLHRSQITDPKTFRARSFADILAGIGYGRTETLLPLVQSWLDILNRYDPDVLIGDYSPTPCAAAHGRVPVITLGDGFVLPPGHLERYPKMRSGHSNLADEAAILRALREVQAAVGGVQPPSVPRLTHGDSQILTVVEELDIYARYRKGELCAPQGLFRMTCPPKYSQESFFVYLTAHSPATRKVLQVLVDRGAPFEAFLRDAGTELKNLVRRAGGRVHDAPPPVEGILRRHHAIIHHGGIGTSQTALAMGRPQILLPRHFEQTLTAERLAALKVGLGIGPPYRLEDIDMALDSLFRSERPRVAARVAEQVQGRNYPELRRMVVAEACRLARRSPI